MSLSYHNSNKNDEYTGYRRSETVKWNILFNYLSVALGIISSLVLIPLYLKFIPVDLYGAWLATGNILVWTTAFDPGLSTVLLQKISFSYGKGDFRSLVEFVVAGTLLGLGISVIIIVVGFFFGSRMSMLLGLASNFDVETLRNAFFIAVIGSSAMVFSYSIRAICLGLQGSLGVGLIYLIANITAIILTIGLLFNGYGLFAIAISPLFSSIGIIIGLLAYLLWRVLNERIIFFFSLKKISELFNLMSFTFLGRTAGVVANNMDLFVVARLLGPEIVPLLHITRRAPQMATGLLDKPASAFSPVISHLIGAGGKEKANHILLRLLLIILWSLGLFGGGFVSFNDDFVRLWVGSGFYAGDTINMLICGNMALIVSSSFFAILCVAMGNIRRSSLASMAEGLLFIPLIIVGTKCFGLLGAVLAPLVAKILTTAWYFPLTFSKMLNWSRIQGWEIFKEIILIATILAILTVGFSWTFPSGWDSFVVTILIYSASYATMLCLTSRLLRSEINVIYSSIRCKTRF